MRPPPYHHHRPLPSLNTNHARRCLPLTTQAFSARCDTRGLLKRGDFKDVMLDQYPALRRTAGVTYLFDFFDTNHDNVINFQEFALGMNRMTRGTLQQKIDLMFQVLDVSGDNLVSVAELMNFVDKSYGEFMEATSFVEELVSMLDGNGDGQLSRSEFAAMLSQNPVLFDTFANSIVPGMDDAEGPFQQLRNRYSGFSIDLLNDVRWTWWCVPVGVCGGGGGHMR